jgi:hypothetical protein
VIRSRLTCFAACAIVFLTSSLPPTFAQNAEIRIALIIGNGKYQFNNTLNNPSNDASDMATALKGEGFKVTLLLNAGRVAMEKAVRDFGTSLKNPDVVGLFYYSGHGAQADGQNYLIPVDADIQDADELRYNALDAESVLAKMRSAGDKLNIVILDACRNNPYRGSSRSGEKGLSMVQVKVPESVIVYATDPGATAADGTGRNSPFTTAFMSAMEDPDVDIAVMMKRVTNRVQAATAGAQTPWVSTNLTRDFAFKTSGAVSAAAPAASSSSSPPARKPTLSVLKSYGSIELSAATPGRLYLDGAEIGPVGAGSNAQLDSVEAGDRALEIHYADGKVETLSAKVPSNGSTKVTFTYMPPSAVPAASAGEGGIAPSLLSETRNPAKSVWTVFSQLSDEHGLRYLPYGLEGKMAYETVAGVPSWRTSGTNPLDASLSPYIYFKVLDPDFRDIKAARVAVVLTYFDDRSSTPEDQAWVQLQYDSTDTKSIDDVPPAFKLQPDVLRVGTSKQWKTVIWKIDDARFSGRTNGNDFRISLGIGLRFAIGSAAVVRAP